MGLLVAIVNLWLRYNIQLARDLIARYSDTLHHDELRSERSGMEKKNCSGDPKFEEVSTNLPSKLKAKKVLILFENIWMVIVVRSESNFLVFTPPFSEPG